MPLLGLLRGTGSTLTSYILNNSPAGEGNAPQKAYAAAFVLLLIVLALNAVVGRDLAPRAAAAGHRRPGASPDERSRERTEAQAAACDRRPWRARMPQCRSVSLPFIVRARRWHLPGQPRRCGRSTSFTGPERMRLREISVFYDGVPAVSRPRCRSTRARCSR